MIKKFLTFIIKAILSVLMAFVILVVFAGLNVEVSERLSYIWLVLSVGIWTAIVLIRRKKKQKKPTSVNNTIPTSQPKTIEPEVKKPLNVTGKIDTPKDDLSKLKKERLDKCIYDLVVIDFETTGKVKNCLHGQMDEVISVAIIDQDGNTLLSTLCSTEHKMAWEEAQKINGITPDMVKGKPTFSEILPQVKDILYKAKKVIAYNIPFEMEFLWSYDYINNFPGGTKIREMVDWGEDPMYMFAAYKGEHTTRGDYKWHKLIVAAEHFDYTYQAHDALEDVKATLHVYNSLMKYVAVYNDKEYIIRHGRRYKMPGN